MATKKKTTKRNRQAEEQNRREVFGICLIALGLFLGASLYSDAVGLVGKAISAFFFGIFGLAGYAVPAVVVVLGVLSIIFSENAIRFTTFFLVFLSVVSLLTLFHIEARPAIEGVRFLEYYKDAYEFGTAYQAGGGMLGALLAYPSLLLIGKVGSYILFIACILVSFLVLTKLSIKHAGEKLGETIKTGVDHMAAQREQRKAELYTETLAPQPTVKRSKAAPAKMAAVTLERPSKQKRKAPVQEAEIFTIEPETSPAGKPNAVRNADGELAFMPTSGTIERKKKKQDVPLRDEQGNFVFQGLDEPLEDGSYFTAEYIPPVPEEARVSRISDRAPTAEEKTPAPVVACAPQAASDAAQPAEVESIDSSAPVIEYQRPPFTLLNSPNPHYAAGTESPQEKGKLLVETLASFNISARIINISVGPVITRFELQPAQGVRVNRITTLSQDIALALAAPRVRIEAPIPGKAAIGIEIPNKSTAPVLLREVVESKEFMAAKSPIAFALGKDIAGKVMFADLDRMPHLLIAGSTGSGKSVCINDIIISMVYKSAPNDVRMILIDPKVVEMKVFSTLPHLLLPVVTDPKKAAGALKWAVLEMEQRYQKMAQKNARGLDRYNSLVEEAERLPRIVIVIDELADLMMVAAKDVEESICRIAQLGRASGIHLIVATQRPSTDIITGLIKANIPSRIAFMVSSAVDSRVIMDESGAEKLLGKGDMLFHANGANKPVRAQAAFVSDEEVERVMDFFGENEATPPVQESAFEDLTSGAAIGAQGNGKQEDELLPEAVKIVLDSGQASISMIQRRLRVGYARAARLIDIMEQMKIVSGFDGSKPRKLLIDHAEYNRMFGTGNEMEGDEA